MIKRLPKELKCCSINSVGEIILSGAQYAPEIGEWFKVSLFLLGKGQSKY